MFKIKILVVFIFLLFIASSTFDWQQIFAKDDFSEEIADYKNWAKVSKDPIKIEIDLAAGGG